MCRTWTTMRLYTSKVIAGYLGLTERRIRQLRDEGILEEKRPGLYDLRGSIARYIAYIGGGIGKENLNAERARLTKEKRLAAEMDNRVKRGELHSTEDIELALSTMLMNFRTKTLAIPAKLSPELAQMNGDRQKIFDRLRDECEELLQKLSNYDIALQEKTEETEEA